MNTEIAKKYDALLFVSFGGPEGRDDVLPYLENVLRGKPVPRARMLEVAEHYYHFDGVSPINQQNRDLIEALEHELKAQDIQLPVYWGNRNWHPMLADTMAKMKEDGVSRVLVFITSAYSSYSGCRQYRENIQEASALIDPLLEFDKLRVFYNHPGFVNTIADLLKESLKSLDESARDKATILFTAHSIPDGMAANCSYAAQLQNTAELIMEKMAGNPWHLVYQSRSGPPTQPWLEPDVCDFIESLKAKQNPSHIAVVPIGFISDHMEVLFDLDTEAAELCDSLGIKMVRVPTVGTDPRFVRMIVELIKERAFGVAKQSLGDRGPSHDVCPIDCCLYAPKRPPTAGRPVAD